MQKIKGNIHYEIIKAAENKKMFKTGIDKNLSEVIKSILLVKKKLNKNEILMFCAIFRLSAINTGRSSFYSDDIRTYYEIKEKTWRKLLNTIYSLCDNGLIVILSSYINRYGSVNERLNPSIFIDTIVFNKILDYDSRKNNEVKKLSSNNEIFESFDCIMKYRFVNDATTFTRVKLELLRVYENIDNKSSLKKLIKANTENEILLNIYILRAYYKDVDYLELKRIKYFFDNDNRNSSRIEKRILSEELKLQKEGIIGLEYVKVNPHDLFSKKMIKIETKDIKLILEDKDDDRTITSNVLTKVSLDFINSKMIYPKQLEGEVSRIKNALQEENYPEVKKKIVKLGYAGGLTFLLHGPSGTGKSRTVYEIAKDTGRKVFEVSLTQLRGNGLVGDSERETRRLFEEYRRFAKIFEKTPILLINEADSVLSHRVKVRFSSDIGHNSQINIILDELDKFEGILFATTNLKDNFDSALDRRFIAKIEFTNPEREIRAIIWKQKLPNLNWSECEELSDYDFSGGIIENIAKKYIINNVFEMGSFDFYLLREMVSDEAKFRKLSGRKIHGFVNTETA